MTVFLMKCLYGHRLETVHMQQYLNFNNIVTAVLEVDIVILLFSRQWSQSQARSK